MDCVMAKVSIDYLQKVEGVVGNGCTSSGFASNVVECELARMGHVSPMEKLEEYCTMGKELYQFFSTSVYNLLQGYHCTVVETAAE